MNTATGFITDAETAKQLGLLNTPTNYVISPQVKGKWTDLSNEEHNHIKDLEPSKRPEALRRYRQSRRAKNRAASKSRSRNRR